MLSKCSAEEDSRVPWTARRSNQSILKEINLEYSLEGLMLKLKLQNTLKLKLWPPDVKSWLTGKGPDAGKDWEQKEKRVTENEMVGWHHWLSEHEFEETETVKDREAWRAAVHGVTSRWMWLSNWTTKCSEIGMHRLQWEHLSLMEGFRKGFWKEITSDEV